MAFHPIHFPTTTNQPLKCKVKPPLRWYNVLVDSVQSLWSSSNVSSDTLPLTSLEVETETPSQTVSVAAKGRSPLVKCLLFSFITFFLILSVIIFYYQASFYAFLFNTFSGNSVLASICDSYYKSDVFGNSQSSRVHDNGHNLHAILRDAEESPDLRVSPDGIPKNGNPEELSRCSHNSCFNIFRCGVTSYRPYELPRQLDSLLQERIKVYVYPNYHFVSQSGESLSLGSSREFTRFLYSIASSPYYTSNPEEACLFVVNLDLLMAEQVNLTVVEQILWSLPYFAQTSGSNHLLLSMYLPLVTTTTSGDSHLGIHIGKAMVAAAGYDLFLYRPHFDVSLPGYSLLSQIYENEHMQLSSFDMEAILGQSRPWTLLSSQVASVSGEVAYLLKRLESIYGNQMLLLQTDCSAVETSNDSTSPKEGVLSHLPLNSTAGRIAQQLTLCNPTRKISEAYLDLLHHSQFCLILQTVPLSSPLLSDCLMSGCIPVILADSLVLPLEERIDWASVAIRVSEHSTSDLMDILNGVSPERRHQLRVNGLNIWRLHFATIESMALTTLDILNERIFPTPRKVFAPTATPFQELSPLTAPFYAHGYSYITPKEAFLRTSGFTAIILGFNRLESLLEVIQSVSRVPSCVKILVVWNNVAVKPPSSQWPVISMPLQIIVAQANKLSNRFFPYASIETEAVFSIDDDIPMLTADEIEFAYQTWRQFPERIVGFPSRLHNWDNLSSSWQYDSEWRNQVSLILTGAAFYHNYYNHLYTYTMSDSIRDWVDKNAGCEDIAMNFLVSNITCAAPIKVTPRKKFKCPECAQSLKLSGDALTMQHLIKRSKCIDHFVNIYQMMPLKEVEFRANPVLYGDNIPEKLKYFNLIGQL